ncbi:LLM class flavin-dependent oxidoreductase [bacterium]|nr:LLM class flavin-dependent oxidoreductase [bacterium]
MRFAIQYRSATYDALVSVALWAERRGLDAVALPDHYLASTTPEGANEPAYDSLALLAGLARDTETIEIVDLVSPVTFRHPAVLGKTAATIQEMSGGRFVLGVGTGWLEQEHTWFGFPFPDRVTRFEMAEEALAYLRSMFSEPPMSFQGEHFTFEAFDAMPRPPLRIVVGGMGQKKTPAMAGRYADEFNVYPAPPDAMAATIEVARTAAVEAGRDPDELMLSSAGVLVAGDTDAEVRERLNELAGRTGGDVEGLEAALRERNAPVGRWDEVAETIASFERLGVERFYIQTLGAPDPALIEADLQALGA